MPTSSTSRAGQVRSARPERALALVLATVPLVLALAWRIGELALPPHHEHAWRDSDGIGVARCFVREGFHLLEPRVMERGPTLGIVGMEFPIVNAAGAVLMKIGGIHDWLARLPCWLSLIPLLWGARALARRLLDGPTGSAIAAACLVLQPLVIIYARKCMPDVPMLAALVWGMVLARDAIVGRSWARAAAAGSLLALAAVLKPTGFAVAVPLAVWLRRALRTGGGKGRLWAAAIIGAAIPVVATVAWYWHARSLDRYGLPLFKLRHDWFEWIRLLPHWGYLTLVFGRVFHLYLLWPTVIWMLFRWRDVAWTARRHPDLIAWIGAATFAVLLIGQHILAHPYYALPLLPPITLLVGAFVERSATTLRRPLLVPAAFMVVFSLTALLRVEQRASTAATDMHRRFDPARLSAAMARVPVDGLTIATDSGTNVVSLVIIDRVGWALPASALTPGAIARLRLQGARTLVETSFGGWLSPATRAALPPPIWSDDQMRAYALPP